MSLSDRKINIHLSYTGMDNYKFYILLSTFTFLLTFNTNYIDIKMKIENEIESVFLSPQSKHKPKEEIPNVHT